MWQELTHARPPGRDCQGRATPCWAGKGEKGGGQREDPSLHGSQGSSWAVGRGQRVGPANRR